jgi:hypothetical protein
VSNNNEKNKQIRFIKNEITLFLIFNLLIVIFVFSCAKIGMPTGGKIDKTPPKDVKTTPKDNSINFNSNTFSVEFDEYIELDNVSQKLIVSPPLNSSPEVNSRLNKLVVKWSDTLKPNTTYIFDFSDAIKDFTEGNKLGIFSYSFSTGDIIDSFAYVGKCVDAYKLTPVNNKLALLYNTERTKDIIRTEKPDYITRLDTFGVFRFRNLAEGAYNLIILDDKNQNFIYDLPNEAIAFSSYSVIPSVISDSVIKTDTLPTFYFFEPKDTNITVDAKTLLSNRKLRLVFSNPVKIDVFNISFDNGDTNILQIFSSKYDTLICYALGKTTFDTLKAELILDKTEDSLIKEKIELYNVSSKNSRNSNIQKSNFAIIPPKKNLDFFENIRLSLPFPCSNGLKVSAKLEYDSIFDTIIFICKDDYLEMMNKNSQMFAGKTCKLTIDSGSFANILGQVNDSLACSFTFSKPEDYGKLTIILNSDLQNLIVVLENMQGKELITKIAHGNAKVVFENLKEEKYKIKVIIDKNGNGIWDIGNFDNDIQPETVKYFDKIITVRKNWEIEETFFIQD